MYKKVASKNDFAAMERAILAFWQSHEVFKKSLDQRRNSPTYTMYDGPPFATGLPHYGHLIQSALKDSFPRYKTMRGYYVPRRFGWDCHGLPVENEAEKELDISGKAAIEAYGVASFNETCRSLVLRYSNEWKSYITRLGRWVDFEHDYKTMDDSYMESIWAVFKQLWDKNLITQGHYIMPYCPRCSTVLSNHELNMGGYKMVTEQSVSVKFERLDEPNSFFIAWTTTPWTLPSNLALAVGPDIEYIKVEEQHSGILYTLALSRLSHFYKDVSEYKVKWQGKGSSLAGIGYKPLFNYFSYLAADGAFRVHSADYVSVDSGSGIVHIANGFGEDDYLVLKDSGLPVICPVDDEGQFTAEVADYTGRFVKACDKDIIKRLSDEGKLVRKENYEHSYPHCWRCESPLIYRAIGSWFVNVPLVRDNMLKANRQIKWNPSHIKEGRFGKWLENARPWAISRNRFWGNPIPVWQCTSCAKQQAIGSRLELESLSKQHPADLHKHFIDSITIPCSCGGTMSRITEVFDCWFESGSMPYAQEHYMFDNQGAFTECSFPADFIAEGIDQTRGWFYTLTVLAAALFDKPAFKQVITTGLVLAADGQKMSKSKKNYTDPLLIVEQYGADAVRLYLQASPLSRGEDLRFNDDGVKEILKSVIIPLWSAYSFFTLYANIDAIESDHLVTIDPYQSTNQLDQWLLSASIGLIDDVEQAMEMADIQRAIGQITLFIDGLNNWYIRLNRRRFWKSSDDGLDDKIAAYATLYRVLMRLIKVSAPFMPFVTEEIYQNLRRGSDPMSIHLTNWEDANNSLRKKDLEEKMNLAMKSVNMALSLRNSYNLKLRQPLQSLFLVSRDAGERANLKAMSSIISTEVNVKNIYIEMGEEKLISYKAKANFKVLGKILGGDMKLAALEIEKLSNCQITSILEGGLVTIFFSGLEHQQATLREDFIVVSRFEKDGFKAINDGSLTLALDTTITEQLLLEGMSRDLVRAIQNLRKESGFEVSDRINLRISGSMRIEIVVKEFLGYIKDETLAVDLRIEEHSGAISSPCGEEEALIWLEKRD